MRYLDRPQGVCVWDPFCRHGSILSELLTLASGVPPGSAAVRYPFFNFPCHSSAAFMRILGSIVISPHTNLKNLHLVGSDVELSYVERAMSLYEHLRANMPQQINLSVDPTTLGKPTNVSLIEGRHSTNGEENSNKGQKIDQQPLSMSRLSENMHSTRRPLEGPPESENLKLLDDMEGSTKELQPFKAANETDALSSAGHEQTKQDKVTKPSIEAELSPLSGFPSVGGDFSQTAHFNSKSINKMELVTFVSGRMHDISRTLPRPFILTNVPYGSSAHKDDQKRQYKEYD
eukprot:Filipodium_phascolosomae@DN197_c0_g1_i2.p1